MECIIRKAEKRDLQEIQEMSKKLIEYENEIIEKPYNIQLNWSFSPDGKRYFEKCIKKNNMYVAQIQENIVGYICFYVRNKEEYEREQVAEIDNLFIKKEWQNSGVGKKLLDTVKDVIRKQNIKYIELYVLSDNKKAIDFYQKNGLYYYNIQMMYDLTKGEKAQK